MRKRVFCLVILLLVGCLSILFAACGDEVTVTGHSFEGNRLEWKEGETFSVEGVTLSVTYSDGTERSFPVTEEMLSRRPDLTKCGEQSVEVTTEGEIFAYPITVLSATITGHSFASIGTLYQDISYDFTTAVLILRFADEHTERVGITREMILREPDTRVLGEQTLEVSFEGQTYETTCTVRENPAKVTAAKVEALCASGAVGKDSDLYFAVSASGRCYTKDIFEERSMTVRLDEANLDDYADEAYRRLKEVVLGIATGSDSVSIGGGKAYFLLSQEHFKERAEATLDEMRELYRTGKLTSENAGSSPMEPLLEDGISDLSFRTILALFRSKAIDLAVSLFAGEQELPPQEEGQLRALLNVFIDIVTGTSDDYRSAYAMLTNYAESIREDEDKLYLVTAFGLISAIYFNETKNAGIDYNDVMKRVPLPLGVKSVDYNKMVEKLFDKHRANELLSVGDFSLSFETDAFGALTKAILTLPIGADCDLGAITVKAVSMLTWEIRL